MRLPSWVILLAFTVSSAKLEENVLKELGGAAGEITEEATTQSGIENLPQEWSESIQLTSPRNFRVSKIYSRSVVLEWDSNSTTAKYRIYYHHNNVTKVENVSQIQPPFELQGLSPSTNYSIWIASDEKEHSSQKSEPIVVETDVSPPSPPVITNLTCFATGIVYVEWTRPEQFDNTIDEYELFHNSGQGSDSSTFSIPADPNEESPKFLLKELFGNTTYEVQVRAGTKSRHFSDKVLLSQLSEKKFVFLPAENCQSDYSLSSFFDNEFRGELSAGMIVGAVAAVLFLLLAVISFVKWWHYYKAVYYYLDEPQRFPITREVPKWEEEQNPDGGKGTIPLEEFETHVSSLHVDSDVGFSKEYDEILKYCLRSVKATHENSSHPDNKCKNRYLNIVAYDHSRVRLSTIPGQKKTSDYINANFIDGYQKCNAYIGTQGPLEHTFEAFWRMVWEQNVYVIVMITNLMERGRRKCDRYWPCDETCSYGNIEVTLLKEDAMANYTVRTFRIKHTKGPSENVNNGTLKRKKNSNSEREIKQFHYTSWPDHGVPCHPLPVLTFIRKSVSSNPDDGGPIIVHCSAGVGRTGTYITIDAMLKQAEAKQEFNVYGFLKHIRGQRNFLVQTEEQYVFLHDALVEAHLSGNTEVLRNDITSYIQKLACKTNDSDENPALDTGTDHTLLEKQFKMLTALTPSEYQYSSARMECNVSKNRNQQLLPIESSRIPLAPKPGVEGSDYINASWLHGHQKLKEFILSQHPLKDYFEDFWRMLWDHNAQTVVLLSTVDNEDFLPFWPSKESGFDLEAFRVRFVDEAIHEGHTTYDFVVSSQHDDYELAVRIIYCGGWPRNVERLEDVFAVLKVVQDWHLEYQDGPLVVVDRFGGTEGATFCALTTLCKSLETFKSVDVYQVAKLYHNKRPGIWKTEDEYLYLYKAIDALVCSNLSNPIHDSRDHTNSVSLKMESLSLAKTTPTASRPVSGCSKIETKLSPGERQINNGIVKSNSGQGFDTGATATSIAIDEDTTMLPGHSVPSEEDGCVINMTNGSIAGQVEKSDDDEEEEMSETAALTALIKGCVVESQL